MDSLVLIFSLLIQITFAAEKSPVRVEKAGGLTVSSYNEMEKDKFLGSYMEISGTHAGKNVNIKIDSGTLPTNIEKCETQCKEVDEPGGLQCSGLCSFGYPRFLGFDKKSGSVFFYQANGFGQNVSMAIYAINVKDKSTALLGHTDGAALSDGKYLKKEKAFSFRVISRGQSPDEVSIEKLPFVPK